MENKISNKLEDCALKEEKKVLKPVVQPTNKESVASPDPVNVMIAHYADYSDQDSDLLDAFKGIFALNEYKDQIPHTESDKAVLDIITNYAVDVITDGDIAFTSFKLKLSHEYDISRITNTLKEYGILYYRGDNYYVFVIISANTLLSKMNKSKDKLKQRLTKLNEITMKLINDSYYYLKTGRYVELSLVDSIIAVDPYKFSQSVSEVPLLTSEEISALLKTLNSKFKADIALGNKLVINNI